VDLTTLVGESPSLWALLVASLAAVVYLFKKYDAVQSKRIEEGREATKALEASTAALQASTKLVEQVLATRRRG